MKKLARYAFETAPGKLPNVGTAWRDQCSLVERWLDSKGDRSGGPDEQAELRYGDGRTATLCFKEHDNDCGRSRSWTLEEPVPGGIFRTNFALATDNTQIAVFCELEAGNPGVISPVFFDVRCPRLIRNILSTELPWQVDPSPVSSRPTRMYGEDGGRKLVALIQERARKIPAVVISEDHGLFVHPNISEELATDLAGLGQVIEIDENASWQVTQDLGTQWSCYNGAIRIYWPFRSDDDPYRHPLWTASKLMSRSADSHEAATQIRNLLRRKLFGLSTLALSRHSIFDVIEERSRSEELRIRREKAKGAEELIELLGDVDKVNRNLRGKVDELLAENTSLRTDLQSAREDFRLVQQAVGDESLNLELPPESESPPAKVKDAVNVARERFRDDLQFGEDVPKGVKTLAPNAGPPDKILNFLDGLSKLARAIRTCAIGRKPWVKWLEEHGLSTSGESKTKRTNKRARQKRTWDNGFNRRQVYEYHMKVTEGTSPDRCVRIYFDWHKETEKISIGWVGRKPD